MSIPPESADVALFAQLACIWEATARKAGNVHPRARFGDLTYMDFLLSAAALGRAFERAPRAAVGLTVLQTIEATRQVVRTNTNLGIVLLLAPLAAVPFGAELRPGLEQVLTGLNVEDARHVYAAIRLAHPGGLGEVAAEDVRHEPTQTLRAVMALAREHDLIARQYVNSFREVFDEGVPALRRALHGGLPLEDAIIITHLELLAHHPDSLIARKRGLAEAKEASYRAAAVLAAGWPHTGQGEFAGLDRWLRAEGHARNPGTSADLVTACLFVALREGIICLPFDGCWAKG